MVAVAQDEEVDLTAVEGAHLAVDLNGEAVVTVVEDVAETAVEIEEEGMVDPRAVCGMTDGAVGH